MSELTRRNVLSGAAAIPAAFARQSSQSSGVRNTAVPPQRHVLSSRQTPESLSETLLPRDRWRPYPTATSRDSWDGIPADIRESIVASASERLNLPYPVLPASLFLEYARNGNRSRFEAARSARRRQLTDAVLAECVEAKGRFLDGIADGIWATCEETSWVLPAHLSLQKRGSGLPDPNEPTIDLFAAETGAMLAWIDYLLGPQIETVHPLVRERIRLEVERRILAIYRDRSDFWWMGLNADRPMNNWNPWINSNCLACTLLIDADGKRRAATVHKILRSLDRFLDSYPEDGACDEGPSYWSRAGGSLFDNLELLHSASGGAIDYYTVPLVREIGRFIYRAHIAGPWFVNFADASAKIRPDGDLVCRYGKAIEDPAMQAFGAWAARGARPERGESLGRVLPAVFGAGRIRQAEARQPLVRDVWLPGTGFAAARLREGSPDGFYFAAQGGHNAESHNHNDVGNFVVFLDGEPVLIDVGVETYSAKTFSSRRYEIWTMQSAYHNLPTVNGTQQGAGRQFAARNAMFGSNDSAAEFRLDIGAAYPAEARIGNWKRTLRLDRRANAVELRDEFSLQGGGGRIEMSFMTPHAVRQEGESVLIRGARLAMKGPPNLEIKIEPIPTTDARLKPIWGEQIYRILAVWTAVPAAGELRFTMTKA